GRIGRWTATGRTLLRRYPHQYFLERSGPSNSRSLQTTTRSRSQRADRQIFSRSNPSIRPRGHLVDSSGVHPSEKKVRSIKNARNPTNKTELQVFLGLINF